jgi:intraflagellar transport protein 80
MRLKFTFPSTLRHADRVDCVGWMSADDLYSVGEDHIIYKYNVVNNELIKIAELAQDLYPLDMHWLPKGASMGGGGQGSSSGASGKRTIGSDLFVLATSDGKFCFVNKSGRIEKTVEAHRGATICVRWSPDGSQFATGGEDGQIRIWARSGMLRSNLVQSATPIFSVCWSADNDAILYCAGKHLVMKPLSPNSKQNSWKAHDQIILKCDWNTVNNLIISGGEDCRYKVWDAVGRPLYSSQAFEYPITSLAWAPDGSNFAVGSYNTIRLCDSAGVRI